MAEVQLNPASAFGLDKLNVGAGNYFLYVILAIVIAVVFITVLGAGIFMFIQSKKYNKRIPLWSTVGNVPTKLQTCKAKEVAFGKAGDKLWFVKGKGIKKWIPPAFLQSGPNEFMHYVRDDGEWINFVIDDLNDVSKKAGVKFTSQGMRLQRLATDKLLEQRFLNKSFMEKWGYVIGVILFFLILTVSFVVFFYQFAKVVDKIGGVVDKLDSALARQEKIMNGGNSLVPATASLILLWPIRRKKWQV